MPRLMSVMNVPSISTQSLPSTYFVISSRPIAPLVEAHVERMRLGDHALAQHRRRHRDARRLGQLHGLVLQPEAMHLDAQQ